MPKILTPAMRAHLDRETTRLAAIWRITRKDGQQFFFTDHDRDIVFGGEVYRADAGFARTAMVWRTVMRARSAMTLSTRPWNSSLPEVMKPTSESSAPEKAFAKARSVALAASLLSAT
jgi:hypothetical protein